MRPIDADAVLDRYYAEYERQDICDGAEDRDWLMKCLYEAPTLTPQNEWVSVEDRLPTKSGEYFVYTTDENISTAEFDEDCEEFGFWKEYYQDGAYLDSEWVKADWITHWMPLPAPPDRRPPERQEDI